MYNLVTRRSVMVSGVLAGGIIVTGGAFRWTSAPGRGMQLLSPQEVGVVEAAAAVLFPRGQFPVFGGDGRTAPEVDRILAEVLEPQAVVPFRSMLGALEWGTLISRGTRFSQLSTEEATHVLDVWGSENPFPRRIAFDSLQAIIGMAFLRRPEVLEWVDWRTECLA